MAEASSSMALDEDSSFSKETDALKMNTIELLDYEKQSLLTEVLKCPICLELPNRKQVLICEKGHHCCSTCHEKLTSCGICRGKLLKGRNFVVEELVTKLGPILGVFKNGLPPPCLPSNLPAGSYPCQHNCQTKAAAFKILPHLREKHPEELIENVRSNPYTGCFSWTFMITFASEGKHVLSVHISDIGLFTVVITFKEFDFFGCVKMLGDNSVCLQYKYQMTVKVMSKKPSKATHQFCVIDSSVASYCDDSQAISECGNFLSIRGDELVECIDVGSSITVFFAVEKQNPQELKKNSDFQSKLVPDKPLVIYSNRKSVRNKKRNIRRREIKAKFKKIAVEESTNHTRLLEGLTRLSIDNTN